MYIKLLLANNTKKCAMTEKDIEEFFEKVQEFQKDVIEEKQTICCGGLRPTLRPYQEDAVKWMIGREQTNSSEIGKLHCITTIL